MPKPFCRVEDTYQHILATCSALNADVDFALFQNAHIVGSLVVDGFLLGILRHDTILLKMCTTPRVDVISPNQFSGVSTNYSTKHQKSKY